MQTANPFPKVKEEYKCGMRIHPHIFQELVSVIHTTLLCSFQYQVQIYYIKREHAPSNKLRPKATQVINLLMFQNVTKCDPHLVYKTQFDLEIVYLHLSAWVGFQSW